MLFLFILIVSCSKDEFHIDPDNLLIGTWTFSAYQDDIFIFDRTSEFIDNHCYKFNPTGTLTERKNSGFCGTPPISYADYSGTWTIINDTLIQVIVGAWSGETTYKLDLELIDSKSFKTKIVYNQ